jgi:hypothetical protein
MLPANGGFPATGSVSLTPRAAAQTPTISRHTARVAPGRLFSGRVRAFGTPAAPSREQPDSTQPRLDIRSAALRFVAFDRKRGTDRRAPARHLIFLHGVPEPAHCVDREWVHRLAAEIEVLSSPAIAFISSALSVKSNTVMFSAVTMEFLHGAPRTRTHHHTAGE